MKPTLAGAAAAAALCCGATCAQSSNSPSVEVLHWWTSGGEAAALAVLKQRVEQHGLPWKDSPISGGGGEPAMKTVRARLEAGMPPTAVQVMGLEVHEWARKGALSDLTPLAVQEKWDQVIPPAVQRFSKYQGRWIAVPINVHSYNWVWANKDVLRKAGVTAEPATWDEFIAAGRKVQQAGHVALAHGGQPWQTAMVFDGVVLATGGAGFYRQAFIERQRKAVESPTMARVFERMSQLRGLMDKDVEGRPWNFASAMVVHGKAAFQIMGDFAKGEFLRAGLAPGRDILCFRIPGSQGSVSFGIDNFAMFKVNGADNALAQHELGRTILDKAVQIEFNLIKGSVPARTDVPDTRFDECGKKGMRELAEASRNQALVPTIAFGHAVPAPDAARISEIVNRHFSGELDDRAAAAAMAIALLQP